MRVSDDVAWVSGAQRVVVMDLARPRAGPYVLEASAAVVWHEIADNGPVTGEALLRSVATVFEIDDAQISEDIEALVTDLVSRDVLVREDRLVSDDQTAREAR